MYVPEKLKLNKFKLVRIPRPSEIVARFGLVNSPASKYSGDESSSPMLNKTEYLDNASRQISNAASIHE